MSRLKSIFSSLGFIGLVICKLGDGKFISGKMNNPEKDWVFVARFCYLSKNGEFYYDTIHPKDYAPQSILLYYDKFEQWPSVYPSTKTCTEKTSLPHIRTDQIVTLNSSCGPYPGNPLQVSCSGFKRFSSSRERWWFIAFSFCSPPNSSTKGVHISYRMNMYNGQTGIHRHFSADEFYILEVDISFLIATLCLCGISIYVAVQLSGQQMFHSTFKLFIASLTCEVIHLIVMCSVYGQYSNDGIEQAGVKIFGRVLEAIGLIIFLLILILMAKGFTITRGRISTSGAVKLGLFMVVYVIVYAVLFFYEADIFDPGLVLYVYESPPGYGLLAMRLIAWLWFCYGVFFTLKHYPQRSSFYVPFQAFFTIWFWAGPCVILAANFALFKSFRATVVNGVERFITFIGLAFFLIGIVNGPSSDSESSDNESFPDDTMAFSDLAAVADAQDPSQQESKRYGRYISDSDCSFPAAADPWTVSSHNTSARFTYDSSVRVSPTTADRRVETSSQPVWVDVRTINAVPDPFCTTNGRSVARRTTTSLFSSGLISSSTRGTPDISTSANWSVGEVGYALAAGVDFTAANASTADDVAKSVSAHESSKRSRESSRPDEPHRARNQQPSDTVEVSDPSSTVRSLTSDSANGKTAITRSQKKTNPVLSSSDNPGAYTSSGVDEKYDPFCTVRSPIAKSAVDKTAASRSSVNEDSDKDGAIVGYACEPPMSSHRDEQKNKRSRSKKKQRGTFSVSDAGDVNSNVSDMSDSQLIARSKSSRRHPNASESSTLDLDSSASSPSAVITTDANGELRTNRLPSLQIESPSFESGDATGNSAAKQGRRKKKKNRSRNRRSDLEKLDESSGTLEVATAFDQPPEHSAAPVVVSDVDKYDHHLSQKSAWS